MSQAHHTLLIVDDEPANLQKLKRTLKDDYNVLQAGSGDEALEILTNHAVACIVTDQRMPGLSGVELLRESLKILPNAVRIILTGFTQVDEMMDAINKGHVHRYITKPWEPHELRQVVAQEMERYRLKKENERLNDKLKVANQQLRRENTRLKEEMEALKDSSRLIFESGPMEELIKMLDRVVGTDSTVLIQGETGTGKELLARYIHDHSRRAQKAFVPVNCGAIPADLVESSFFGHKKGSFTGAVEDAKGYFETAHEGTLFLDEIGEASMDLQVKLLRVLQEGEIYPVGSRTAVEVDVRVIGSTNRNLSRMVDDGKFRQDLFFRLNVFSVHVPPLRTRPEDVAPLARYFLKRFSAKLNKPLQGFDSEALEVLKSYSWPGNVRELENEVERMVILADQDGPLSLATVSERIRYHSSASSGQGSLKEQLAALERRLILESLRKHSNNKSRVADALGVSRQTIISKLKDYQAHN
ncbi:MAG TPA: sigma-54 dependent transcriptional regulator [Acidobacteriota bacterium]|nr:sigma-54 dependent transcriptional regulator [Acidobacteriota bacterium]